MKVLNLYAGISGNRKLWTDVEVTAIENNESIAAIYQDFFPNDKMIITDAHQYLLEHFKEYDFIWSSPPCLTHSRFNLPLKEKRYPDMNLYQQIILLKWFFKKSFCVENVISYYEPLLHPIIRDGHYFWSNFKFAANKQNRNINTMNNEAIAKERSYDLKYLKEKLKDNDKAYLALRNCVLPKTGLYILECAKGNYNYLKQKQMKIF